MPSNETAFTALRIEGSLLPPEFLARIAALEAGGQTPTDYGVPPGRTLRDEIGRYWSIAEALWKEFREQRQRVDVVQNKIGIERWLVRLLSEVLGYADLTQASERTQVGERSFPITHRAHGGGLPLVLTTFDLDLDRPHRRFGEDNRRRSPHAALQEYLNAEPWALWGVAANGVRLRIVRDNPSLTRPAFVEVDLERMFEEGLYADFAALWLLAHASRAAPDADGLAGRRWEAWRSEGAKVGQRALDNLRAGVTGALRELGGGFVAHPDNEALRAALRGGTLTPDGLHQQLLRLVYRLLLLLAAEDRDLLHPPDADQGARDLYKVGYSLMRLRDRARFKRNYDGHRDLWSGLTVSFRALARGALPLGLPALGGLFNHEQCPDLDGASITNGRLLAAMHALAFFTTGGSLQRINYRDMGAEELGSVYESLLELHPVVQVAARPWMFGFVGDDSGSGTRGSERKLSGSYYTPDSLVQELLRSALDPVIERTIRENSQDPCSALLALKIIDPACGSGHFLLGAARRMADALARLEPDSDLSDEPLRRHALREVVRRCIYGVDRNPLSVELCKTALWIETIEPGKPLSFLDAHIKCGDSLVGVFDLKVLRDGIPDEAFKELTGDDKAYARDLKKRNKAERDNPMLGLLPEASLPSGLTEAVTALDAMPDDTVEAVEAKRRALREIESGESNYDLRVACDLWCAAFFLPKSQRPEYRGRDLVPTTDGVWSYLRSPSSTYGPMIGAAAEVAGRARFLHWPLAFPDVFAAGGFDVVLGNPPWERIKLQEQEFFAARHLDIAAASNAAARRSLIEALRKGDSADQLLHRAFEAAKRDAEAASQFVRGTERFPLTAVGDVNTYALFAEAFSALVRASGRAGMIVPIGIVTDDTTKAFFGHLIESNHLRKLTGFSEIRAFFPSTDDRKGFCNLTVGKSLEGTELSFHISNIDQIGDDRRTFTLSSEDLKLINPNTRTCPVFRSSADAELTKRIYGRVPVLIDEARGAAGNPWGISFTAMLHMSNDSHLFLTARQLADGGAQRQDADWGLPDGTAVVPLYEAKMIHHYDHRWATYERDGETSREQTVVEKADPGCAAEPRYWVPQREVQSRLSARKWSRGWLMGWRDISLATVERTTIAAVFPVAAVGNSLPLMFIEQPPEMSACLLGCLSSLACDFVARHKIGGNHLNYFVFRQLAVLAPTVFDEAMRRLIVPRVIELTYTANNLSTWANDLGYNGPTFTWENERRALLRAELDAIYARLYGLTRDELRYILDPTDIYGAKFPSETFRVLKEKEIRQHGEYRTARLVLAAWDRFEADGTFGMRSAA
jgi:hypothetical protein